MKLLFSLTIYSSALRVVPADRLGQTRRVGRLARCDVDFSCEPKVWPWASGAASMHVGGADRRDIASPRPASDRLSRCQVDSGRTASRASTTLALTPSTRGWRGPGASPELGHPAACPRLSPTDGKQKPLWRSTPSARAVEKAESHRWPPSMNFVDFDGLRRAMQKYGKAIAGSARSRHSYRPVAEWPMMQISGVFEVAVGCFLWPADSTTTILSCWVFLATFN